MRGMREERGRGMEMLFLETVEIVSCDFPSLFCREGQKGNVLSMCLLDCLAWDRHPVGQPVSSAFLIAPKFLQLYVVSNCFP